MRRCAVDAPGDAVQFPPGHSDRGALPGEPCSRCGRVGGVWFLLDDSPYGRGAEQVVSCNKCKATWTCDPSVGYRHV